MQDARVGTTVETGQVFPYTGYYSLLRHKNDDEDGCFVSPEARYGMLFERGEEAPDLLACPHVVVWKLDIPY
ncbi:MAG: hypothetical protein MPJ05_07305 [Nitrosopumilus sp.]|nr:hypothetical protein [Nitrosopumilus sp.]